MFKKLRNMFVTLYIKLFYESLGMFTPHIELYYRKRKLVVRIKNEETKRRSYDIVKSLYEGKEIIYTEELKFTIIKYYSQKPDTVDIAFLKIEYDGYEELIENKLLHLLFNIKYVINKETSTETEFAEDINGKEFKNHSEILNFMFAIDAYIFSILNKLKITVKDKKERFNIKKSITMPLTMYCSRGILENGYRIGKKIESNILCIENDDCFRILNRVEISNLALTNIDLLEQQIIKMLFNYLSLDESKIQDSSCELKKISSDLATEFGNYILGKDVNYKKSIQEFLKYPDKLGNKRLNNEEFKYMQFCEFSFKNRVEDKYGIKIEKKMNEMLPDGRVLITFGKNVDIIKVVAKSREYFRTLNYICDEHVKLADISEIVCTKTFKAVGYITTPIKGERFSIDTMSNKDFLKLGAYLFTRFDKHFIKSADVFMDKNFVFYITTLDFEAINSNGSKSFKYMIGSKEVK